MYCRSLVDTTDWVTRFLRVPYTTQAASFFLPKSEVWLFCANPSNLISGIFQRSQRQSFQTVPRRASETTGGLPHVHGIRMKRLSTLDCLGTFHEFGEASATEFESKPSCQIRTNMIVSYFLLKHHKPTIGNQTTKRQLSRQVNPDPTSLKHKSNLIHKRLQHYQEWLSQ